MRIMAIDYGDAHTGVAISDPTGFMAGTTTTIHSRKAEVVLEELAKIVAQYKVEELVMGFPRNMDGSEGPRADLYREFADKVEQATGLKPVLWDERRTTIDAHRILFESGQNAKKRKKTKRTSYTIRVEKDGGTPKWKEYRLPFLRESTTGALVMPSICGKTMTSRR